MIAIPTKDPSEVDLVKLYKGVEENLPTYARPIFIRFIKEVELTGSFKLKKTKLQEDGFSLEKIGQDPLYFMDAKAKAYIPLETAVYEKIVSGEIRL